MPPEMPAAVADAMDRLPGDARTGVIDIRRLIFDVAAELGVGPLTETLKWGEPAYLTEATKAGTTIRLGARQGRPALFFNCQTPLVEEFRTAFPDAFDFEGNRVLILTRAAPESETALRHCIRRALSYHRDKRARAK